MDLTILGSHGTWPAAGGATSGLLVTEDGSSLWIDTGTGTLANLQRHIDMFDVDAVVISHSHPDHVTDIYAYLYARLYGPTRPPKIPLLLAPGVLERAQPLVKDDEADPGLRDGFDIVEVRPGDEHRIGPFHIRTAPMRHTVPTIGVRVEADGAAVAYSADTAPTEDLTTLARDADILVAEASWQGDRGDQPPIHMTAREAGGAAAAAGAGRLVLTHIRPHLDRKRSEEEARETFDGDVWTAEEHVTLEVGR